MTDLISEAGQLMLVPATNTHMKYELSHDYAALYHALDVAAPPYWPPDLNDDDSFRHFQNLLETTPEAAIWGAHYVVLREGDGQRTLVGNGGYVAPPDANGVIEIGYSILAPFRRRGHASGMCKILISQAFANPRVSKVIAHTLPDLVASIGVLKKAGFKRESEADGIVRFVLARPVI